MCFSVTIWYAYLQVIVVYPRSVFGTHWSSVCFLLPDGTILSPAYFAVDRWKPKTWLYVTDEAMVFKKVSIKFTPNGNRETHALAIEFMQSPDNNDQNPCGFNLVTPTPSRCQVSPYRPPLGRLPGVFHCNSPFVCKRQCQWDVLLHI